jgi:nitroreductase
MNTIESIHARRAIKHFDTDHRMTEEEERKLFEATVHAPTSFNIQHWRFVVLRDPELRAKIRKEFGNGQAQMTNASLLEDAPRKVADLLVGWMGPFHEGREWLQRDQAQRSIGLAMQTMMLAAKAMGYDSCPMIGFDLDKVVELLGLPEDHIIGPMVAIGKGTKGSWPKPGQLPPLQELVVENHF